MSTSKMLKCTSRAVETSFEPPGMCVCVCGGGGGGYSHILAIRVCRWKGDGFQAIYSGIGSSNHRKFV